MRTLSTASLLLAATVGLAACMPAQPSGGTVPASSSSSSVASAMASSTPDMSEMIRNLNVKNGDTLKTGMVITGEARGNWYFEASFPVNLVDDKGVLLAAVPAQAQGEWMTDDFAPFSAKLVFTTAAKSGTLILKNDNPSGLPENDKSIEIPVLFE
ncbi:MAG TPA: Gmad2 immunoglobulin-like domain-containing protein [Candidatus Peribacteria bacterium]|nr:Gmad2 immunoglobulin-like domain-containing protein [Candidatus Peribacteria bacterium]